MKYIKNKGKHTKSEKYFLSTAYFEWITLCPGMESMHLSEFLENKMRKGGHS